MFSVRWTASSEADYRALEKQATGGKARGRFRQVQKTLRFLASNPRHPGLQTHEYRSLTHPYDPAKKVFEAYAQNRTPGAYRVFWCYGPKDRQITIIAITPHP